jgi:hypothetical protein
MRTFHLVGENIESLLRIPESGMGFQLLEATFWGERRQLLVLYTELAIDLTGFELAPVQSPVGILENGLRIIEALKGQREIIIAAPHLHSFDLLSSRIEFPQLANSLVPNKIKAALPSSLVKQVSTSTNRAFHRFSAFNPDRRVDPKTGNFAPGTYGTPDSEVPFVPSGFAAVGRFALPNNQPASYHYMIEAPAGTSVLFGTVAPAFGQAGGGVEAFFPNGVQNQLKPPQAPSQLPDE